MGKTYAVILAAGQGTRFGGDIPKQFLELSGKPLWQLSMEAFFPYAQDIVIVTNETYGDLIADAVLRMISSPSWNQAERPYLFVTAGGESRAESVLKGLRFVEWISRKEPDGALPETVLIHDAARCLVSPEIIEANLQEARRSGAAIAAVPATDTIKIGAFTGDEESGCPVIQSTPDRRTLYQAQTPQSFSFELILNAYSQAEEAGALSVLTDDASAVERFTDHKIILTPGSAENIKVTRPLDLAFAESILRFRASREEC